MKKYCVITILLVFAFALNSRAQQSDCTNIGFENGNFTGWKLEQGWIGLSGDTLIYNTPIQRTLNEGHRIMSVTEGYDPVVTDEAIPVVAPGSRFSARIGNKLVGAIYDRISTSLQVTENNSLLIYRFAIVLQSPDHPGNRQPKMVIKIIGQNGFSDSCGSFEVSASRANTIFRYQIRDNLVFRNWTTAAINLHDYIGQTITISVTTNDCMEGAHFGYAYFDAECFTSRIYVSSGCSSPSQGITLTAPDGFQTYQWQTGDTTKSIFIPNPVPRARYSVRVKPYYALSSTCDLTMEYIVPDSFLIHDIHLTKYSCNPADSGTLVRRFVNKSGCDSMVTIRTNWIKGGDTTFLNYTSCNPRDTGVVISKLNNVYGCDSFVQKKTILLRGRDTTFQYFLSCYPRDTGVIVTKYTNFVGCDSFVSRRTRLNTHQDTTYINATSCNPQDVGLVVSRLSNVLGCDSFVFKNTFLLRGGDTTYVAATSCNERDTGVFVTKFINKVGCDSFVRTKVLYDPVQISLQTLPTQCQGQDGEIMLNKVFGGKPPFVFSINDSLHFQNSPVFSHLLGDYYTLFVRDSVQCISRFDSILVERKGCTFFVPNAFSPNGDGVNDEFKIFAPPNYIKTIKNYRIFSRWGNLVYETPHKNVPFDTFTDWWNGYLNNQKGQYLSSDVFVYMIEIEYFDAFKHLGETLIKGDITVLMNR